MIGDIDNVIFQDAYLKTTIKGEIKSTIILNEGEDLQDRFGESYSEKENEKYKELEEENAQ